VVRVCETERMKFLEVGDEVVDSLGVEVLIRRRIGVSEFIGFVGKTIKPFE